MKRLLLPIILCYSFIAADKPVFKISAGSGTEQLIIGKTKITDVFALYGKQEDYNMGKFSGGDFTLRINRYYYRKLGLTFLTYTGESKGEDTTNALVADIVFGKNANASTVEGIAMGKDSLQQIRKRYGEPEKKREFSYCTTLIYVKKGIAFTVSKPKNRVTEIEVFRPGSFGSEY